MKAVFTLTPAESRRLIAKAVVQMPEIRAAWEKAYIVISGGTTNAFVAQELLNIKLEPASFTAGISSNGILCVTRAAYEPTFPIILYRGEVVKKTIKEAIEDFHKETVIIKGANAVDPEGNTGVVTAGFDGGTVGATIGYVMSQGIKYVMPVGLEKMIPSVKDAVAWTGAKTFDESLGADFGMFMITNAIVVTEIVALRVLADVQAVQVAAGGIGGSEGAVVLVITGTEENVRCAMSLVRSIKGEPRVKGRLGICSTCRYSCYYKGKSPEELPAWLTAASA